MNRCLPIMLLALNAFVAVAQPQPTSAGDPEAICGYGRRFTALKAGEVKQGLSVQMLAGDTMTGQAIPLRFRVTQKPVDEPVDDLQVEHEKLMHVIVVRDDLQEFFHIHPQRVASGMWQVIHTFTNGGQYQVWSDVKHRGTVYSFAQPRLNVAGAANSAVRETVPKLSDSKGGYTIKLEPVQLLTAGTTNRFVVTIRDESGNPVSTEFFLGALMHVVIVKDDLTVYSHAHAEEHVRGGKTVSFTQVFPRPGNYKLFVQFRPNKTRLPSDEAILAQLWVKVQSSN